MEQQIHFCTTHDGARIDLKNLRRDLDIQSEMKRSTDGAHFATEHEREEPAAEEPNSGKTLLESDLAPAAEQPREGSVHYRIAALVAMLVLATVALILWYYSHS